MLKRIISFRDSGCVASELDAALAPPSGTRSHGEVKGGGEGGSWEEKRDGGSEGGEAVEVGFTMEWLREEWQTLNLR